MLRKSIFQIITTAIFTAMLVPLSLHAQSSPLTIQPSTGNVGIGTTNPTYTLSVSRDTGGTTLATFEQTATSGGASIEIYQKGSSTPGRWQLTATGAGRFKIKDAIQGGDKFFIDTTGFVGIGVATPTAALEVIGDIKASGTKYFQIDHPNDKGNKFLLQAAIEGPESAVFYRGEAKLVNGEATVDLPNYFEALTRPNNRTVQLTPIGGWAPLYVVADIKDGRFTVRSDQGGSTQRFFWEVKAVRADIIPFQPEVAKPSVRRFSDPS